MRSMKIVRASALTVAVFAGPAAPGLFAQAADPQAIRQELEQIRREFEALRREYGDRIAALEARLGAGESPAAQSPVQQPTAPVPAGADAAGGPTGVLPVYGGAVTGSKVFNPDIAVVGDFLGSIGKNAVHPDPFGLGDRPNPLQMHEAEVSLQAVVDPYARGDFFMAFGEEGVELEEGFITFTSLPWGLLTKVGKMRAAFGKVNGWHTHNLPWADRPLVINNLVGGEEGIGDAGISVARLVPNPWLFLEATGQLFRGDSGPDERPLFRTSQRRDVSYAARLRAYQDVGDDNNVDVGFSHARGHNPSGVIDGADVGRFTTRLFGVDATYRWRPLRRSLYRSFVGRTEWIWSRRDQPTGLQRSRGLYFSGDYQLARRWFAGGRYDRSHRADDASLPDTGGSVILTFWPSEFSQVRGQYRRTNYAAAPAANELLFQFQFSIGAHGAHPF
jgi:hypothetical protein